MDPRQAVEAEIAEEIDDIIDLLTGDEYPLPELEADEVEQVFGAIDEILQEEDREWRERALKYLEPKTCGMCRDNTRSLTTHQLQQSLLHSNYPTAEYLQDKMCLFCYVQLRPFYFQYTLETVPWSKVPYPFYRFPWNGGRISRHHNDLNGPAQRKWRRRNSI